MWREECLKQLSLVVNGELTRKTKYDCLGIPKAHLVRLMNLNVQINKSASSGNFSRTISCSGVATEKANERVY